MQLPHDAFVVVADGRKMLFFRNKGDSEFPHLIVEHAREHPNPKDSDQKTDAAGRGSSVWSSPAGGGEGGQFAANRGSMTEVDFHQQEEDRFAAETAEFLKKRALAQEFDALVVVAPPKTLGELRKRYHKEVTDRLLGELDKDLTGVPVREIEAALSAA